jgi:hypothetical protein
VVTLSYKRVPKFASGACIFDKGGEVALMGDKLFASVTHRSVLFACVAYFAIAVMQSVMQKLSGNPFIFGSFWESGRAASAHANPYLDYPLVYVPSGDLGIVETNLNPPAILPLFQGFALFDPAHGAALWVAACAVVHIGCVLRLYRRLSLSRIQIAWLLLPPVVLNNFNLGQIYTILFSLAVGIWLALEANRIIVAGVLLGVLVAIKPNFALCGIALFAAGYYRIAVIAAIVSITFTLLPALLYGPQIYQDWLTALSLDLHGELFPNEISLNGYLNRAGAGVLSLPIVVLVMVVGLRTVWRSTPSPTLTAGVGLWLGVACSPLAWIYYFVVLMPTLVGWPWTWRMILAAALMFVPPSLGHAWMGEEVPTVFWGTVYLLPMLLMGWEFLIAARNGTFNQTLAH